MLPAGTELSHIVWLGTRFNAQKACQVAMKARVEDLQCTLQLRPVCACRIVRENKCCKCSLATLISAWNVKIKC